MIQELMSTSINALREIAKQIERLQTEPLADGETIEMRVRQIALQGEVMARLFLTFDHMVASTIDRLCSPDDTTAAKASPEEARFDPSAWGKLDNGGN